MILEPSVTDLVARARQLSTGPRRLLGLTGPPGAGKSTLAAALTRPLGPAAVLVPMDGFHLAQAELHRLGRRDRKGAPDTFDAAGYVALLRRLRDAGPEPVYAPAFDRCLEEPVAGSIRVEPAVPLIVTEGNYLLLPVGAWQHVRPLLDEVWYVDADPDLRVERLIRRHVRYGRTTTEARAWVLRSDEDNARLISATRDRADLVVTEPAR
jgi:pantothenate kinase